MSGGQGKVKVLSLFDGMACGHIAMQNAGVEIESYDAYEIDRYAIKVASHNFPDIVQHGDVFKADFTQYEGVDFVVGGSPCTYWSIAQKNNRETEASGMGWELFSQYVRAIREAKPRFFIYENNKSMSKQIRASIDEAFGFDAVGINSALVSAQNRQRLYWVGKREPDGTYSKVPVEQPEDRGILLRDILESGVPFRNEKAYCLDASYYKGGNLSSYNRQSGMRLQVAEPVAGRMVGRRFGEDGKRHDYDESLEHIQRPEVNEEPQKTNCLTTVAKDNVVVEPIRVGTMPNGDGEVNNSQSRRIYSVDGKSRCLMANANGGGNTDVSAPATGLYAEPVRIGTIENGLQNPAHDSKQYRVYSPDGKATTICGQGGGVGAKTGLYAVPCATHGNDKANTFRASYGEHCGTRNLEANVINNGRGYDGVIEPFENVGDAETVQKSLPEIAEKLGYVPEMFNAYNRAEITDKSPTLSTGSMVTSSCATCKFEKADRPIYEVRNGMITIKDKQYPKKLADGYYIIRKLTVRECMRLQTVPEWYDFSVISNSQAYKCLGNGWTCDFITHLILSALNYMPGKETTTGEEQEQQSLFTMFDALRQV